MTVIYRANLVLLALLAIGCSGPRSDYSVATRSGSAMPLSDVALLQGDQTATFGYVGEGGKTWWPSPLDPHRPWVLTWRDGKGQPHQRELTVDPQKVTPRSTVTVTITDDTVVVEYEPWRKPSD